MKDIIIGRRSIMATWDLGMIFATSRYSFIFPDKN